MNRTGIRQRYFVLASSLYLLLGAIIVVRAALAHSIPVVVFGVVLIALGAVRLRDYRYRGVRRG